MCELFGVSSKRCIQINDYLKKFYSHSDKHPHGWGLALMQDNQSIIDKQPIKALDSEYLHSILSKPVFAEHAFAHIRLATMGYIDSFNCHPFTRIDNNGRTWTLIHNGTIFKYEALNKFINTQTGETDSERVLLYIINQINSIEESRGKKLDNNQLFNVLSSIIACLAKDNKLNLMLFNGEYMFIHTNCRESLYFLEKDDSILFATTPLSDDKWKEVPLNTLFGIKNGQIDYIGEIHENEYNMTEKHVDIILNNLSPSLKENVIKEFGGLDNVKKFIYSNHR